MSFRGRQSEPVKNGTPQIRVAVDGRVLSDRYHGIGRVTEALLREFSGHPDLKIIIVIQPNHAESRFDPVGLASELGYEIATFDHAISSLSQFFTWPKFLRELSVDVALFPYSLAAPLIGRTPSYAVVHDCIFETDRRWAPSARVRWLYRAVTTVSVHHNRVVTPSHASAEAIKRFYRINIPKDRVIPLGVDPSFALRPTDLSDVVGGEKLPPRFYLQVGARRPHKNVKVLVEAMAQRPDDEHLILIGTVDPRFPDAVPDTVKRLGLANRVHHLPHVTDDELRTLYHRASGFLYPSLIEGVGLPLLEAMAADLPVVASDIPVFREFASGAAWFVAPNDPSAWAHALSELSEKLALVEQRKARGRELAVSATWQETARRFAALFRNEVGSVDS